MTTPTTVATAEEKPNCAPVPGSAPALNLEQREILYHTEHRAAGGFYCGGGKDMDALVAAGLMESAGRKSFVPDEYFRITGKGRHALRAQNEKLCNSPGSGASPKPETL